MEQELNLTFENFFDAVKSYIEDKEELESNCNSDNFSSDSDNNNDGPDDIEASSDKYNNDQEESSDGCSCGRIWRNGRDSDYGRYS